WVCLGTEYMSSTRNPFGALIRSAGVEELCEPGPFTTSLARWLLAKSSGPDSAAAPRDEAVASTQATRIRLETKRTAPIAHRRIDIPPQPGHQDSRGRGRSILSLAHYRP